MTEWLMIIITAIYVVATILICIANFKSAKATREQVDETRKQHEETLRLQTMPYLQVILSDGLVDENDKPQTPYMILDVNDTNGNSKVNAVRRISIKNIGLGIAHQIKFAWNPTDKKSNNVPDKDVIIPPQAQWGINVLLSAEKPTSDKLTDRKVSKCAFEIEYDDLLGNTYQQNGEVIFVASYSELHEMYYYTNPPTLVCNK